MRTANNLPTVLGGDFNTTWDDRHISVNLDTHAMQNIPSIFRTNKLRELCTSFDLVDPYCALYPNKRDYTFVPSAVDNLNRSRIDMFLINVRLLPHVKNCLISPGLLSAHFDHKCISLNFKSKIGIKNYPVKNCILKEDEVNWQVNSSVIETYIQHAIIDVNYTDVQKNLHLLTLGRINIKIQESLSLKLQLANIGTDNLLELQIAAIKPEVEELFDSLPDLPFFENLPRPGYCNDGLFFDTLVHCVRNGVLLQQKNIFNVRAHKKQELISRLKKLKQEYTRNSREIHATERQLNGLISNELRSEILQNKKFEVLNDEKMTAHFVSLTKIKGEEVTISEICDDNGSEFLNVNERSSYIKNFYGLLYKKPNENNLDDNSIPNFLGDVAQNRVVLDAKLNEEERLALDQPLTLAELDNSINGANMKSAPGPDGITNPFIKHFWNLFRVPLLKYANNCYQNDTLSDSFRRARIRLIPKKGNTKHLKNWRPISLLNCFYKIISRAFTNRLKDYMDKLTPIAQKGYSTTRQCQEVLIAVLDIISNCKKVNKRGAILSLDIKKAFDTVSHQFLSKVLDFFNFGPYIKKWLKILGTNRQACIILEDDLCTDFFDLERGNAQGDTISPFLFNLCYQILLFKLQYDLQINSIAPEVTIPATLPPLPDTVSTHSPKVYGLADDATVLTTMEVGSLTRVKHILEEFGDISGLECNVEKTILMQIGSDLPIEQEIKDLGFDVKSEITLLGLTIENDTGTFGKSFGKITTCIQKEINFWNRFYLSLPGRIAVAKAMLYSQLNYLGNFLPLENNYIQQWSDLIENFVVGPLNIAKNRRCLPREEGDLGLFDIKIYLGSQKCNWIKRSKNLDDYWKQRIYSKSLGDIFNVRSKYFDKTQEPVLHSIVETYEKFLFVHSKSKENIRESLIFENDSVFFLNPEYRTLDSNFFDDELRVHTHSVWNLKVKDIVKEDGTAWDHISFCNNTGINMRENKFRTMRDACLAARDRYRKIKPYDKTATDIGTYLCRVKKGSRHIRRIFCESTNESVPHNIVKFSETAEIVLNYEESKLINGLWGRSFFDNATRTFLFKLHNNTLGTNARVSHFARDQSRLCTFCNITRNPEDESESVLHLFFQCRSTEPVVLGIQEWALNNRFDFESVSRRNFFGVYTFDSVAKNIVMQVIGVLIKKYIWDCKTRHGIPNLNDGKDFVRGELDRILSQNSKMNKSYIASGLNIYRE